MDVILGVAVEDRIARLALVGSPAQGQDVIDQFVVDLADNPIGKLTETIVGTNRLLADENHRLLATRLCWSDPHRADELRRALEDSGVQDVVVLSASEAATVLQGTARAASSASDDPTLALARGAALAVGFAGDATAMAPAVGLSGDATAMAPAVGLSGDATAMAPAVGLSGDATAMAPATQLAGEATGIAPTAGMADAHAEEPQLAYSMADDGEPLPVEDEFGDEYYDDEAETGRQRLSGRSLLISNAVVAFAVIGFASLAVAVAISVRPTAASVPVVGHQNAAPGKFMPLLPTQQQAPVPPPPPDQPNAGYQGGTIPDTNGYLPQQVTSPGGGETPAGPAPVPASPGIPGLVPNPNGPIPIPIIIPFPGWRPPYPPYAPPIRPTTTYPTPPTITPSPPTSPTNMPLTPTYPTSTPVTPSTPSTPSSAPPSTPTSAPTTSSKAPPTSSKAPYTSSQAPTSAAPPSTQYTSVAPPHVQTQQTVAPKPANPQPANPQPANPQPANPQPANPQPANPQLPRSGHH